MELLGLLGISAFAIASLVVGVRLLWLARRTRQFPELMIGASFLLAGFLGLALTLLGRHGPFADGARVALSLAGTALGAAGYSLLAAFVWRVFRAGSAAGALGFGAAVLGFSAGFGLQWSAAAAGVRDTVSAGTWLSLATQAAVYVWASWESFHRAAMARRRVRLGLLEPLVAHRFLLWGVGTAAVVGICVQMGFALWSHGRALTGAHYLAIALLGFTCAIACWIAFLPPRAYARRFAASRA
jgi:hypothetical protein